MIVPKLRPSPLGLLAAVGVLVAVGADAVREFVWADLQAGLIRQQGLSRVTRGLIWLGFGLLFAMVATLLYNDVWRISSPLIALTSGTAWRGTLMPAALAPATLFLLAMAWSFGLAGALRSHWLIRLAVLLLYVFTALGWMSSAAVGSTASTLVSWVLLLAVPIFFAIRWRSRPRPATEFAILLALVGATFALLQATGVETWQLSGVPNVLATLSQNLLALSALVFPLLMRIGVNFAEFAYRAAGWATSIVADRLPRPAPWLLLAPLLLWRLSTVLTEAFTTLESGTFETVVLPYLAALATPLGVGLIWWIVTRPDGGDEPGAPGTADSTREARRPTVESVADAAGGISMPLVAAFVAPQLFAFFLAELVLPTLVLGLILEAFGVEGASRMPYGLVGVTGFFAETSVAIGWRLLFDGSMILLAGWLARRGRRSLALYLGVFGLMDLRSELMEPGYPLSALYSPDVRHAVEFWWVVLFAGFAAFWLARGRLTRARASGLIFLLLTTWLLRQTDFLSNPFSPILGATGVFFIAFGIIWDTLTIGSWANVSTPALPRVSRIFLYLGYALITVAVVNWALTVHDLGSVARFTGEMSLVGFERFGRPLIYAIFAITLALPPTDQAPGAEPQTGTVTGA